MRVTVFVNERPVSVETGASLAEAISILDPHLGGAVASGRAYVTDGVGRRLPTATTVFPGAIFRVITSGERREESAGT